MYPNETSYFNEEQIIKPNSKLEYLSKTKNLRVGTVQSVQIGTESAFWGSMSSYLGRIVSVTMLNDAMSETFWRSAAYRGIVIIVNNKYYYHEAFFEIFYVYLILKVIKIGNTI